MNHTTGHQTKVRAKWNLILHENRSLVRNFMNHNYWFTRQNLSNLQKQKCYSEPFSLWRRMIKVLFYDPMTHPCVLLQLKLLCIQKVFDSKLPTAYKMIKHRLGRAGWSVAQKVWQTSGTVATGVTVARGSPEFWKMWQTSGSGRPFLKNRGKLVLWQTSGKAAHPALTPTWKRLHHTWSSREEIIISYKLYVIFTRINLWRWNSHKTISDLSKIIGLFKLANRSNKQTEFRPPLHSSCLWIATFVKLRNFQIENYFEWYLRKDSLKFIDPLWYYSL